MFRGVRWWLDEFSCLYNSRLHILSLIWLPATHVPHGATLGNYQKRNQKSNKKGFGTNQSFLSCRWQKRGIEPTNSLIVSHDNSIHYLLSKYNQAVNVFLG